MSRFNLKKSLSSTRVTRELVRSLEIYVEKRTESLAANPTEELNALLASRRTTVTDDLGTEQLGSIDEYASSLFSNTTTSIEVEFIGSYQTSLRNLTIRIRLSGENIHTGVQIDYDAPNAREVVVGLYDGIKRCLETSPARNAFFHPPAFWQGVISAFTYILFLAPIATWRFIPAALTFLLIALSFTLYLLWSVAPKFRPYTVFDSEQANRYARDFDWLIKGLLSFLLFGTLMTLMRDRLLSWFHGIS